MDRAEIASTVIAFGPFRLDRRARKLLRDGVAVALTARAFDTLEVLVLREGRTVSKEELLQQVWRDTFVQEETLTQNMSTIRRTLEDTAESPRYIVTVPREGYRFIAPVRVVAERVADAGEASPPKKPARWGRHWRVVAAVSCAAGVSGAALVFRQWPQRGVEHATAGSSVRVELYEPEGSRFSTSGGTFALSPDGTRLAFVATGTDGEDQLWVRSLDALQPVALKGTEGATQPFWSPDSQMIAFFADKALRKVKLDGSMPQTVCLLDAPNALAGTWNKNGDILFAIGGQGIYRVSAAGGTPAAVPIPGADMCRRCLMWPQFFPDGNRFLFVVVSGNDTHGVYVGALDGQVPARRILETVSSAAYIAGHLIYWRAGALMAQPFDQAALSLHGDPLPIAESVAYNTGTARAAFTASQTSLIAYREPLQARLTWISRSGEVLSAGPTGSFDSFAISPDGGRIIAAQLNVRTGTHDLWMYAVDGSDPVQVTFDPASEIRPLWSPDGRQVVFARETATGWRIDRRDLASGEQDWLPGTASSDIVLPLSWRAGALVFSTFGRSEPGGFWSVRPGTRESPFKLWPDEGREMLEVRVSPDGRLVAFTRNDKDSGPGHRALYLRPFAPGRNFVQIAATGNQPRWRGDGRELFFIGPGGTLRSTLLSDGGVRGRLDAKTLCTTGALASSGLIGQTYDIAPDGTRILVKMSARSPAVVVRSGWLPRDR